MSITKVIFDIYDLECDMYDLNYFFKVNFNILLKSFSRSLPWTFSEPLRYYPQGHTKGHAKVNLKVILNVTANVILKITANSAKVILKVTANVILKVIARIILKVTKDMLQSHPQGLYQGII